MIVIVAVEGYLVVDGQIRREAHWGQTADHRAAASVRDMDLVLAIFPHTRRCRLQDPRFLYHRIRWY